MFPTLDQTRTKSIVQAAGDNVVSARPELVESVSDEDVERFHTLVDSLTAECDRLTAENADIRKRLETVTRMHNNLVVEMKQLRKGRRKS